MITIYHNPRCSKSREGLCEIESLNQPFKVRKYLDEPFTKVELEEVIKKLNIHPIELVRTKESIWIENYKGKELSDLQIIQAMLENPKLIERPIIVNGNNAVIGRPIENINKII
ncbi:arsenate reductase (glutaredoxin) [Flavobacterium sp.]|jgi:arsenate reductase|uniref:arsenate reductase (glutaredoxin) n=1 Tax=Flavobacterium sp. TaxID=239 RepID=UPI0037C0A74F